MSTVGLIIAFVVYAIIKMTSSANADKTQAAPQSQGEVFPPVEFEGEVEASPGPAVSAQEVAKPAVQSQLNRRSAASCAAAEEPVAGNKAVPKQKEEHIRIKGKTEARRAFIYSEIFNRKY